MQPIEQTGSFYLGRRYDAAAGQVTGDLVMYDARDLTTHAVIVGMTGSGKTGLGISLLEEAAIDGVPAIIIDPKGDIANLALTFPGLAAADFAPWLDPEEARRQGLEPAAHAEAVAARWKQGLGEWDQDGARIARLKAACAFTVFTPGSTAGEPVSILASLQAPAGGFAAQEEALRDRIRGTVGAILGLAGVDGDPVRSPAHIFLATVIEHYWRLPQDVQLADLIRALQEPPVRTFGVFDVDTFFPAAERRDLALALNGLMAAPGFAAWLQGTPLDIDVLLGSGDGRPRHAIMSIAHLDDAQRMFFVTLLLESLLAWSRRQSGTSSLRAMLYMDELFGFMPPTANPPSKTPLLTLLKQARASGLGVVLATQNPVDLDYKGLANAGTWFIGKLQTERDKERMLEGLAAAAGAADPATLASLIGGLKSRVFLLHNVHESAPALLHTRWTMSYLGGPLTREQIRRLGAGAAVAPAQVGGAAVTAGTPTAAVAPAQVGGTAPPAAPGDPSLVAPALAASVPQAFLPPAGGAPVYEPLLAGLATIAFVDAKRGLASERQVALGLPAGAATLVADWTKAAALAATPDGLAAQPAPGARFLPLPRGWEAAAFHKAAAKALTDHLYQRERLEVFELPLLKLVGEPGETRDAFLNRARLAVREKRDAEVDKLDRAMQVKLTRLETKQQAEQRDLAEDQAELAARKQEEMLSAGESLLGMFGVLGRKRGPGLATAARKRRMTARAGESIAESQAQLAAVSAELEQLRAQLAADVAAINVKWEQALGGVTTREVAPRRTDIRLSFCGLLWRPAGGAP
ncbi:MAG: DUF87 domain-containing protein [bacterium]|nr:DUF87 domain-containing protein [bacterium]